MSAADAALLLLLLLLVTGMRAEKTGAFVPPELLMFAREVVHQTVKSGGALEKQAQTGGMPREPPGDADALTSTNKNVRAVFICMASHFVAPRE